MDPQPQSPHFQTPSQTQETGPSRQRARIACTRCRRLRKKCMHENPSNIKPPCIGCREAGSSVISECRFPARGEPDFDRRYRRNGVKRTGTIQTDEERISGLELGYEKGSPSERSGNASGSSTNGSVIFDGSSASGVRDGWTLLPPYEEVVEACKIFGTSFFQLGFLPKALFLEQLANARSSINVFFLLGVLSVSARFTPSLIARYGDGLKAAETFMERASKLVIEEMYTPTLERTQAFFLLAIAEWGKGDTASSNIHMGIAVRMAGILRLHREETYILTASSTAEDVINAEMARRTFWMLESQDNLHSGYTTPVSFSLTDITTLLPCEERDFSFGLIPQERAALAGTLAANRHPEIVHTSSRSLFATLIQAHNLWGQVARGAVTSGDRYSGDVLESWHQNSDYTRLALSLKTWEDHLPPRHKWSIWNFRGYKAEGLDLAYLSVVMVLRLSNIILRRSFIENILNKQHDSSAPLNYWQDMSSELFENVLLLHEQIDAFASLRSAEQGFPAMIVFCVYVCGSLANHLWKRPEICPGLAVGMEDIVKRSLKLLSDLQHPWQLARKWKAALEQRALVGEGERGQNTQPVTRADDTVPANGGECQMLRQDVAQQMGHEQAVLQGQEMDRRLKNAEDQQNRMMGLGPPQDFDWTSQGSLMTGGFNNFSAAEDDIEAQLIAFLQVQGQLGMLYD